MKRKKTDLTPRDKMLSVANDSILNREFHHFNCKIYEEKKDDFRMKNYSDASCIILTIFLVNIDFSLNHILFHFFLQKKVHCQMCLQRMLAF